MHVVHFAFVEQLDQVLKEQAEVASLQNELEDLKKHFKNVNDINVDIKHQLFDSIAAKKELDSELKTLRKKV